jgi:hypothetical protein
VAHASGACKWRTQVAHGPIDFDVEQAMENKAGKNRTGKNSIGFCLLTVVLASCGDQNTDSNVTAPGEEREPKTAALEAGADLLQSKAPLRALDAYLDGFHFYSGNMQGQMEAHHYCGHLNEDVIQCVIFDGNEKNAKVMGVEYIVSAKLFTQLPAEEKHLWHSHVHEVKSGQLIAPGIPELAEHELMEKLVGTYGKTWHTWHTDQHHELPIGTPQLMMGFIADGQINEQLVADRDQRFEVSTAENRENRADISSPAIDPDANAWTKGIAIQLEAKRK